MNPFQPIPNRSFPKLQTAAFALMVFLSIFIPIRLPLADLTLSSIKAVPDALIVLLFVSYLIAARFRFQLLPQDGIFLAFAAVALVSTCVVNGYGIGRYIYQMRAIALMYVLYFVLRDVKLSQKQWIRIIQTLQVMTVILLLFAAIEKISFKLIAFSFDVAAGIYSPDNYARVYSLFYNPNTYGTFLVFVLVLSVLKHRYWNDKTPSVVYGIIVAQLYLSMSRSSIMILALGLVLLLAWDIKERRFKGNLKRYAVNVLTCLLCTVILSGALNAGNRWFYNTYLTDAEGEYALLLKSMEYSMSSRFGEFGQANMYDNSHNLRIFFFQTGLKVWEEHPVVGTGFGTFGTSASLNYGSPLYAQYGLAENFYADDEYITILVETGAVGAALFGCFLLSILWQYRRNPFKIFFCLAFGWYGIFFNIFEVQIAALLFWTALSMDEALFERKIE